MWPFSRKKRKAENERPSEPKQTKQAAPLCEVCDSPNVVEWRLYSVVHHLCRECLSDLKQKKSLDLEYVRRSVSEVSEADMNYVRRSLGLTAEHGNQEGTA